MLSQAVEDYLKAIYKLQGSGRVSTNALAERLAVSPASASKMVQRLSKMGFASYESYRGVKLTPPGEKIALEIIRHHRLLETYLKEVMGYAWDKIHDEAEQLEHHISEDFEDKIDALLGYPTNDPHGDPIPTRDGVIVKHDTRPLTRCKAGETFIIRTLVDRDPKVLEYLESRGLLPNAVVQIIEQGSSQTKVQVVDGKSTVVDTLVARSILVSLPE